jgi:hypothetical protein
MAKTNSSGKYGKQRNPQVNQYDKILRDNRGESD